MVFPNEHLMNRDKAEFELLISLSSMGEDKVTYRVGIDDFKPEKNALIIVDEIDIFMLDDPCKFKAIIAANPCIGLTATPANTPMEKKVAE
jgi:superfamily II DNA or RNA helicase